MDFQSIELRVQPTVRMRYIKETQRLQELLHLSGDVFEHQYLSDPNNLAHVRDALDSMDVGALRKAEYLRSVGALLSAIHVEHKHLQNLLKEFTSEGKVEREELDRSPLFVRISDENVDPLVRIMCAMICYDISADLSVLVKSTIDDPLSEYNYDTTMSCWHIKGKQYTVPALFTELVQKIKVKRFTTVSLSTVSRMFKVSTGHTYTEYRYREKPSKLPIVQKDVQHPDNGYSWDKLHDVVQIHIDNINRLSTRLERSAECFDTEFYNTEIVLEKIKEISDLALNTKHNIVTALCVVLDATAGRLHNEYTIYRMELELQLAKSNLQRKIPWFPNIYGKLYEIYKDTAVSKTVRIICLMAISNVERETLTVKHDTETGILRPSDLISTRFDGTESYIDLREQTWLVHEDHTKNKQTRQFKISETFANGINEIYGDHMPQYLIVTETGTKYQSSVSETIFDALGINFDIIRSSYFTWREATVQNREELLSLCWRQGHKYSTAMQNYKRQVDYSIQL